MPRPQEVLQPAGGGGCCYYAALTVGRKGAWYLLSRGKQLMRLTVEGMQHAIKELSKSKP